MNTRARKIFLSGAALLFFVSSFSVQAQDELAPSVSEESFLGIYEVKEVLRGGRAFLRGGSDLRSACEPGYEEEWDDFCFKRLYLYRLQGEDPSQGGVVILDAEKTDLRSSPQKLVSLMFDGKLCARSCRWPSVNRLDAGQSLFDLPIPRAIGNAPLDLPESRYFGQGKERRGFLFYTEMPHSSPPHLSETMIEQIFNNPYSAVEDGFLDKRENKRLWRVSLDENQLDQVTLDFYRFLAGPEGHVRRVLTLERVD